MKRIILFFTVCLGLSVFQTTFADDANAVRAASKRTTTTVSSQHTSGRATSASAKRSSNTQNSSKNTRTVVQPQQRIVSRTTTQQTVKPRESTTKTTARTTTTRSVNLRQNESKKNYGKPTTSRTRTPTQTIKHVSRATELNNEKITTIKSLNYSKCKTVYYECMDEFCANKDTNLRRCACSSRIHEFDDIKKQLSNAEDKMLNFNQRLLTVNLDKEDAAAINVATEGELGFSTKDTSASEKLLQKITDSLNNSGDSKISNNLSAISLSLDIDSAWDSVDSTSGIATSAKSGVDLYNAANPVCIAMAKEVCSDDELDIAKDGYKLTIQQDCDTVAKSYKTQYNSALEKIYESSALLDMSRLNVYQQRNSDDTLTCKKKILNQLSDTSVCGENLYKCLDMTGQYIDPSTGNAFLSENLSELSNLLQEPTDGGRWSKLQHNDSFVNFLDSKKKFLEPAIKQCQDISDMVWQDFLDDALAQIKLAQNAKLEEIRQSCTTLVSECKTNALQSLSDFDARALSTFNVVSDKTANKMCSEVETACSGLMGDNEIAERWKSGMSSIAADITYQKVIETCTTVGRDCIVRQCNGTSGNFALCQNATDNNRRAILNRDLCWDEVLECVQNADNLSSMKILDRETYYNTQYDLDQYDINNTSNLPNECNCTNDSDKCKICHIAEQIWGNCEYEADKYSITTNVTGQNYKQHNKILFPKTGDSLLSWFATNTGTVNSADSCNSKGCQINYEMLSNGTCQQIIDMGETTDCKTPTNSNQIIKVTDNITNYCVSGVKDNYGNCCASVKKSNGICVPNGLDAGTSWQAARLWNLKCTPTETDNYLCPTTGNLTLYCVTKSPRTQPIAYYTQTNEYACGLINANYQDPNNDIFDQNAMWVIVDEKGNYYKAEQNATNTGTMPVMYYKPGCDNNQCTGTYNCTTENNKRKCAWTWGACEPPTQNTLINYNVDNNYHGGTITDQHGGAINP